MHRLARLPAAALIAAGGVVHLQLWRDGYRGIPRIGPLFLVNVAASLVIAVALVARRRAGVAALAGAALSAGSLAALALSRTDHGVLGFMEAGWSSQAIRASLFEAGALVALVVGSEAVRSRLRAAPTLWPAGVAVVAVVASVIATTGRAEKAGAAGQGGGPMGGDAALAIRDFKYSPAALTASAGTPIAVTNADGQAHTVTADAGDAFDTGDLPAGATTAITIERAGRYAYHCSYHPFMTGTITVN